MSSVTCTKLTVCILSAVLIQIIGLSLFVLGFFPVKPALSGFSGPESFRPTGCGSGGYQNVSELRPEELKSLYQELCEIPPSYDRLVLMVIDGLPAEFVLGKPGQPPSKVFLEAMPYTQSLLANGMAVGFHAKAAPPTVTMPRLKAMVSGAIGGFLDVAFNFNTQAFLDDNIINQFFSIGWKMVMLGDETWLKLFPGLFTRHDGVSSFYVKDTVVVDQNVSRHLSDELDRTDWSLLVLHYLGLDHVGHIGGRSSVLMGPKLKEMDEVIKTVHKSTKQFEENTHERTLLVVVSDHGMTDNGNHGGSSYEETDSLVLFVGLKQTSSGCHAVTNSTIDQIMLGGAWFWLPGLCIRIRLFTQNMFLLRPILGLDQAGFNESSIYIAVRVRSEEVERFSGFSDTERKLGVAIRYTRVLCCDNIVLQDIAPTLALLFGVPVPKNNVGIVIPEISDSLTDDQWLRTLELNSLQILRLLKAELSGLSCEHIICDATTNVQLRRIDNCQSSDEEMFCCLFENAVVLHNSWRSKRLSGSSRDEYGSTVSAYYDFLRATSQWLSRRATHKPVSLLTFGVAAMVLSCFLFIGIFLWLDQEIYSWKGQCRPNLEDKKLRWHLDDYYVLAIISILVASMGSSSMVEEEQYIWHFLTSTFYLILLRKAIQSSKGAACNIQIISIIVVLISGRIMRGWHQGGVNWTHLPDISNWLEQAGNDYIKSIQLVSWVFTLSFGLYCLWMFRSRFHLILMIGFSFLLSGLLVLRHIINHNDDSTDSYAATSTAQTIYATLGFLTIGSIIGVPWLIPAQNPKITPSHGFCFTKNFLAADKMKSSFVGFRDPLYVVGWAYIFCWCLLQLLLQQPINSMPVALLLLQIMASIICFSNNFMNLKQWVEVAALYSLGMAGHFALGNTNTLATIDVAGAFIGISSHSTILSGILMFFITYASPMLAILSLVMYTSLAEKSFLIYTVDTDTGHFLKTTVCFPCLVPLGVNSILLLAYTIVLLLMRNHLFVWSVFSPKYLYVCATTVCVYVGVVVVFLTAVYTTWVVSFRRRRTSSTIKDDKKNVHVTPQ